MIFEMKKNADNLIGWVAVLEAKTNFSLSSIRHINKVASTKIK